MKNEQRALSAITPYEKNPRLNDDAVDAVAASIERFGFRVPLVVDEHGVIVCGHARFKATCACRALGRSSTAASIDGLTTAVTAFRAQTDKSGKPSKIQHKFLLMPLEIESVIARVHRLERHGMVLLTGPSEGATLVGLSTVESRSPSSRASPASMCSASRGERTWTTDSR